MDRGRVPHRAGCHLTASLLLRAFQEALATFPVTATDFGAWPCPQYDIFGLCISVSRRPQEEACQRCTTANPEATHHKHFGVGLPHRPFVETQCMAVEPMRAWLHVVPKRQTQVLKLSYFLAVLVAEKVHDVCNAQSLEL